MNKFDILWEGEYVSVVSPKEHPYENLHEINGIMVIPIVRDKIGIRKELVPPYLLKDETGKDFYYTVLSGGVEEGEAPEEAADREIKEEAGIEFKSPKITEVFREMPVCKSTDMRMTFFIYADDEYDYETPEGDGTELEEIAETIWVTLEEFKEIINQDNIDFLLYSAYYFLTVYLKKQEKTMESNLTINHLGDSLYQIGDNDVPIDKDTLISMISSSLSLNDIATLEWLGELEKEGAKELIVKTGEQGVIVDLYEVEYDVTDPMKATQELASHLDEREDFVTQYLFPGSVTEEVLIGLRQDIFPKEKEALTAETSFKIVNQREISTREKNYIQQTGKMPALLFEDTFGVHGGGWVRLKFRKEGRITDAIIGKDTFRYIVALQEDADISHFSIDYKTLLSKGINPLDLRSVINEAHKITPDKAEEDRTLDELISVGNFEIRNVAAIKGSKNE